MAQEVAVADRLISLAGWFEKFRDTGRTFDGADVSFIADELNACAQRARETEQEAGLLFRSIQANRIARKVPATIARRVMALIDGACA